MPMELHNSMLSTRAQAAVDDNSDLIWEVISNLWHAEHNPNGFVSLGVAENCLMHEELLTKVNSKLDLDPRAFTYGDGPMGGRRVRAALARFLSRRLKVVVPLRPEHLILTNGCSSAIEHCSWALADPGDALLLGRPFYGTFPADVSARPGTALITVSFGELDPMGLEAVGKYEEAIMSASQKAQAVKGIILCSPHNPLGRCYSRDVLVAYMKLCQKHQIHLISDEIYALSVWKNKEDTHPPPVEFTSVLSINTSDIIAPHLVHVLWGMSKDFGANGIRVGCIISQNNKTLLAALLSVALYSSVSSLAEYITANLLEDDTFTDQYIATNQARLSESYSFCVRILREHKIEYAPGSNAAFFLWANLGEAYRRKHPQEQLADNLDITEVVTERLLAQKLFLADGTRFGSEKPGWYRIVFSQPPEVVVEGMRRLVKAVES